MISQRFLTRTTQLAAGGYRFKAPCSFIQNRFKAPCSFIQNRFTSSEVSTFKGSEDNAFIRERLAIKQHAAATSELWRKLSIYAAIPAIIIASVNAWILWEEHWEHFAHLPPLEERTEYAYQNIRNKRYFWGDGDKTLFWNDKVNYHKKD